jgi:hypothetical protein
MEDLPMSFLIAVAALVFLMFVAYRGFSVIELFEPAKPRHRRAILPMSPGTAGSRQPHCSSIFHTS